MPQVEAGDGSIADHPGTGGQQEVALGQQRVLAP